MPKVFQVLGEFFKSFYNAMQCSIVAKTINTRLPVSNPIMWQFEKVNIILGICNVFPFIEIIPPLYSTVKQLH
jgi:hypothetical protein